MRVLFTLLLLAAPLNAWAQGAAASPAATLFKALAGLVLVLGLVLLLYAVSRRGLALMPGQKNGRIKILESRGLGPKKALYLVEIGGQELLLGVGAERIELLTRLEGGQSQAFDRTLRSELEIRP
ncbi:flagellar biosynthetic protein FliO [Geoalkalibacter sp.]|uniref:flagellar biosynthetic protein FliO n=1 Tax=Geoalkalibacter sp. TaxID=3041440 RepID=UPI00272DDB95|nr:flagellar biosynthetic protein FliO [Geoalkalibacter sp.]